MPCSAGFKTCCIADFQIGNAPKLPCPSSLSRSADLEIRDTAGLEVGATSGPQSLPAVYIHLPFSARDRCPLLRDKPTGDTLHLSLGGRSPVGISPSATVAMPSRSTSEPSSASENFTTPPLLNLLRLVLPPSPAFGATIRTQSRSAPGGAAWKTTSICSPREITVLPPRRQPQLSHGRARFERTLTQVERVI
jgi:hypothetical protein